MLSSRTLGYWLSIYGTGLGAGCVGQNGCIDSGKMHWIMKRSSYEGGSILPEYYIGHAAIALSPNEEELHRVIPFLRQLGHQ